MLKIEGELFSKFNNNFCSSAFNKQQIKCIYDGKEFLLNDIRKKYKNVTCTLKYDNILNNFKLYVPIYYNTEAELKNTKIYLNKIKERRQLRY